MDLVGTKLSTLGIIRLFSWLTDAKTAKPIAPPEVSFPELLETSGLIWCVRSFFRPGRCYPSAVHSPSSGAQPIALRSRPVPQVARGSNLAYKRS